MGLGYKEIDSKTPDRLNTPNREPGLGNPKINLFEGKREAATNAVLADGKSVFNLMREAEDAAKGLNPTLITLAEEKKQDSFSTKLKRTLRKHRFNLIALTEAGAIGFGIGVGAVMAQHGDSDAQVRAVMQGASVVYNMAMASPAVQTAAWLAENAVENLRALDAEYVAWFAKYVAHLPILNTVDSWFTNRAGLAISSDTSHQVAIDAADAGFANVALGGSAVVAGIVVGVPLYIKY